MKPHPDHCEPILDLASEYLDGRLDAPVRARVQDHLGACSSCFDEYRVLRRLSRLSAHQPLTPPPHDLSERVHRTLHERRGGTLATLGNRRFERSFLGNPVFLRVAAALILVPCAAGVGFWVGRGNLEQPPAETTASSTQNPLTSMSSGLQSVGTWKAYTDRGFEPAKFTRAGRSLSGDVSSLNGVAPDMQVPLLASQIAYFDLVEQARRFEEVDAEVASRAVPESVRLLARFIRELSEEIESRPEALRDRAAKLRSSAWLTSLPRVAAATRNASRADPRRLRALIEDHGPHLEDAQKQSLVRLLNLKHAAVHGLHQDVVMFVHGNATEHFVLSNGQVVRDPAVLCDPFCENAFCWVIADVLPEIGLEDMARPYRNILVDAIPAGLLLVPDEFGALPSIRMRPSTADFEEMIEQFMELHAIEFPHVEFHRDVQQQGSEEPVERSFRVIHGQVEGGEFQFKIEVISETESSSDR